MLRFAVDTADPANGALLARVQERGTAVETKLLFFELEWAARRRRARRRAARAPTGLETTRHHLRTLRRYRPHLLSEPEEKLMTEKALTGRDAWTRLFSELTSAIRVELPDADEGVAARRRPQPPDLARPRGAPHDGRGGHRRARAGPAHARLRLQHAAARQGRRRPPALATRAGWRAATSPTRPATSRSQALVEAVRANYDLPQRWYRLKAELLGLDQLADYDRMASVADEEVTVDWPEATDLVLTLLPRVLARAGRPRPSASSTSTGSTRRCARTSAAARSAPTRRPACTPT